MHAIGQSGRLLTRQVPALIAPVVLALALAGCSDDSPGSRNTPLQPGTQGSGEPDFALLWNAGPEAARLSDELAAFVARAFQASAGDFLGPPATGGVLQQTSGGNFTWQPGAAGTPIEVRTLDGRVIELTLHSASAGSLVGQLTPEPYTDRETLVSDWNFDVEVMESGVFDVRIVQEWLPAGDARLDAAESAYGGLDGDGFDRTVTGSWQRTEGTWQVQAVHRGIYQVYSHGFLAGESLTMTLEGPGQQLSVEALIGLSSGHSFHTNQGGGNAWKLDQTATHVTGGTTWSLMSGALLGSYFQYAGYAPPVVPDNGGWNAAGEIHRNGEHVGRFAFAALVQPGSPGEPVAAMQGGVRMNVQPAGRPAPVSLFDDPFIVD